MVHGFLGGGVTLLHRRIVELRKKNKLTQEGLAKKIGVTRSALSQYELDVRQPDYDIIKRMADYFDVSIDYLLGRDTVDESHSDETQLDKDRKYALELFNKITDPEKKKAAFEVLKGLAGEK